jgi:putative FmdB family regulatory protein
MPIYGFECGACGHRFDRLQKLSDPDPTTCPACAAESIRRQLTAPAFRLAGSGWYETDFKKDGDKKRNLVDSAPESTAGKSESSAESSGKSDTAKPDSVASKPAAAASDSKPGSSTASTGTAGS